MQAIWAKNSRNKLDETCYKRLETDKFLKTIWDFETHKYNIKAQCRCRSRRIQWIQKIWFACLFENGEKLEKNIIEI